MTAKLTVSKRARTQPLFDGELPKDPVAAAAALDEGLARISGRALAVARDEDPSELTVSQVERAAHLLAKARTLDVAKHIRDVARGLEVYRAQKEHGSAAHADAWEIVQRANRRIGEITREMTQAKRGRKPAVEIVPGSGNQSKSAQLKAAGITPKDAYAMQRIANMSEREFESRIGAGREKIARGLTPNSVAAPTAAAEHDGDEWGTPEEFIVAAREVLGRIELDPASNAMAQNVVRADRFYTKADSGLGVLWKARTLWLNPPYSKGLVDQFCEKFVLEHENGNVVAGIALVNSSTEVGWYQSLIAGSDAMCLPSKRISFLLGGSGVDANRNRYAQTFFYVGPDVAGFARVFGKFGQVLVRYQQGGS